MMTSTLNIEFSPIVADRNYAATRTFVPKWDVEIDNNHAKKKSRNRDRDTKYFIEQDFEYQLPYSTSCVIPLQVQVTEAEDVWDIESSDDGEETRQRWLRAVEAENAYYDRKYGKSFEWYDKAELDADQGWTTGCKRTIVSSEESDVKRVRA